MRINGIRPVRTRKHKVTTNSNHRLGIAANWLDGDFPAAAPNQKWAGDITYIWTAEGWLYLAVVLDLHSRRVVGWAVSDRMKKDLAIRALDMAVNLRQPAENGSRIRAFSDGDAGNGDDARRLSRLLFDRGYLFADRGMARRPDPPDGATDASHICASRAFRQHRIGWDCTDDSPADDS
jgi:transposase InsO family protein